MDADPDHAVEPGPDGRPGPDGGSDAATGSFERWALVGCVALAAVAVAAFALRRGRMPADDDADLRDDRTLRVELGGPTPTRSGGQSEPENVGRHVQDPEELDPAPGLPDRSGLPANDTHEAAAPTRESPASEAPPAAKPRRIVVRDGETLGEIAQRELGSARRAGEIARLNDLRDANDIRAGQTLVLPRVD